MLLLGPTFARAFTVDDGARDKFLPMSAAEYRETLPEANALQYAHGHDPDVPSGGSETAGQFTQAVSQQLC